MFTVLIKFNLLQRYTINSLKFGYWSEQNTSYTITATKDNKVHKYYEINNRAVKIATRQRPLFGLFYRVKCTVTYERRQPKKENNEFSGRVFYWLAFEKCA